MLSANAAWTIVTLLTIAALIFLWRTWRRRIEAWRKRVPPFKSLRQDPRYRWAPAHPPPRPFHVNTKLGDPGDPRTGITTRDTDNLFAGLRRFFGSRERGD